MVEISRRDGACGTGRGMTRHSVTSAVERRTALGVTNFLISGRLASGRSYGPGDQDVRTIWFALHPVYSLLCIKSDGDFCRPATEPQGHGASLERGMRLVGAKSPTLAFSQTQLFEGRHFSKGGRCPVVGRRVSELKQLVWKSPVPGVP